MYGNEEKGFILTEVILQLLFLVLFVFALIWLFPTKGFINNMEKQTTRNTIDYQVLSNHIFNDNLIEMKEAAKSYYTTSRLPRNTGDKISMTLGEMMEKKLILSIQDKNGNSCDVEKSYVEIMKQADEYQLKVVLNCASKEDYLIVHLGCYQYYENGVYEKTNASSSTKQSQVAVIESPIVVERPVINNDITIDNCVNCNR